MGVLLPTYRKSIIEDIISSIQANTAHYYAFASCPILNTSSIPDVTSDDYSAYFTNNWQLLFGKKISNTDIFPVIRNVTWVSNTVYDMYDNTKDLTGKNFYVIVPPSISGGEYNIYKCIDNANGSPSLRAPDLKQYTSFTKADGYTWRYITTIDNYDFLRFSTRTHVPLIANSLISSNAYNHSGIDNIIITNPGKGYNAYTTGNGFVKAVVNTTLIQIENYENSTLNYFKNNSIYLFNSSAPSNQLRNIIYYVSNTTGNWITLDAPINTSYVTPGITNYLIGPQVVFDTDADSPPKAYVTINTVSNSISNVVIVESGYGVTRANVSFISNPNYPIDDNLKAKGYVICPPPGGHGADLISELDAVGFSVAFKFSNNENGAIPTNISYTKIGLYKNIYNLNTNLTKGTLFGNVAFSSLLDANVAPKYSSNNIGTVEIVQNQIYVTGTSTSFTTDYVVGDVIHVYNDNRQIVNIANDEYLTVSSGFSANATAQTHNKATATQFTYGETVRGATSNALGIVASSNGLHLYLTGDKNFIDGENIVSSNGTTATIGINTRGSIYTKDLEPLYYQNIANVTRSDEQTESFKLIVQI